MGPPIQCPACVKLNKDPTQLVQVVWEVPHVNKVPCCVEGSPRPPTNTHVRLGWHLVALQVPCREVVLRFFFYQFCQVDGLVIIHPTEE
jgi:hypothetical protein